MSNKSDQLALAESFGAKSEEHKRWWYTHYLNGLTIWPSSHIAGQWITARHNTETNRYEEHQKHEGLEAALIWCRDQ